MDHWKLKRKKALITGASKGIGRAINEEFLQLGASSIIVSRNAEELLELEHSYRKKGWNCRGFAADLSRESEVKKLIDFVDSEWHQLDVLVNNVGANLRKPTFEFSVSDLRQIMQLNVETAFSLCLGLHNMLKRSGSGSVINLSSIASQTVVQTSTIVYHMSKGALDQLNDFLAVEWGKDNIRVNAVHPWYITTPLAVQVLKDPEKKKAIENVTPLRRVGEPKEVARVAAFLAMDASSYVSGANIRVDGAFAKAGMPVNG